MGRTGAGNPRTRANSSLAAAGAPVHDALEGVAHLGEAEGSRVMNLGLLGPCGDVSSLVDLVVCGTTAGPMGVVGSMPLIAPSFDVPLGQPA